MSTVLGLASMALGLAYTGLGVITIDELRRDTRSRGFSRFGAAFALMAFSCGPHHLVHGHHVLAGDFPAEPALLVVVLVGVVPGWIFVWLRLEAFAGGRGERVISGTPAWLTVVPAVAAVGTGALVTIAAQDQPAGVDRLSPLALTSYALVACYLLVGWFLVRTQVRRHRELGLWSLSGLSLSAIFVTCALMHLLFGLGSNGDLHMVAVDALGVPAALYFLYVVRRLYRESLVDWNRRPLVGTAGPPARPSPWS